MRTFVHFWQYLSEFFLEWEMFETNVVEKKHILCSVAFSPKILPFMKMCKNIVESGWPQMAI
jgi:hypothetical protein